MKRQMNSRLKPQFAQGRDGWKSNILSCNFVITLFSYFILTLPLRYIIELPEYGLKLCPATCTRHECDFNLHKNFHTFLEFNADRMWKALPSPKSKKCDNRPELLEDNLPLKECLQSRLDYLMWPWRRMITSYSVRCQLVWNDSWILDIFTQNMYIY